MWLDTRMNGMLAVWSTVVPLLRPGLGGRLADRLAPPRNQFRLKYSGRTKAVSEAPEMSVGQRRIWCDTWRTMFDAHIASKRRESAGA